MYLSKQARDTSSSFFIIKPLFINVKAYPWGWVAPLQSPNGSGMVQMFPAP